MRSWLSKTYARRIAAMGFPALLILSATLVSAVPEQAWGSTYNPEFMTRIKNGLKTGYDADLNNANDLTGCQYVDQETATGGFNEAMHGSGEPSRGCQNSATASLNDRFDIGPKKFMTNAWAENPNTQYFVKQEGNAVMACTVTYNVNQAESTLKQNAVFNTSPDAAGGLLTPVAFFNNLDQPDTAPAQKRLRILTAAGGGDLMKDICSANPSVGICDAGGAAGSSLVQQAMQSLNQTARQNQLNEGGSSEVAYGPNGEDILRHASLTEAGVLLAAQPGQRSTTRPGKDTADKTKNRSDNRVPNENDGQSGNCTEQSMYRGGCSQ